MGSYEPIVDLSKRIESHQDFACSAEQLLKSPQTLEKKKKKAEKALRKANASESAAPEVAHEAPTEEAVPAK